MKAIEIELESGDMRTFYQRKGKINSSKIAMDNDGKFLTFFIEVKYDAGTYQSMGGIVLGISIESIEETHVKDLIQRINNLMGVHSWEELVNKEVYTLKDSDEWGTEIIGLKNLDDHTFFIDHWRKDNFSNLASIKKEFIEKDLPKRYEKKEKNALRNRLKEVE